MMTRREMLRTMGLVAAGVVAADQLEILDRLAPRSLFASAQVPSPWPIGIIDAPRTTTTLHGLSTSTYQQCAPMDGDFFFSDKGVYVYHNGRSHKVTLS